MSRKKMSWPQPEDEPGIHPAVELALAAGVTIPLRPKDWTRLKSALISSGTFALNSVEVINILQIPVALGNGDWEEDHLCIAVLGWIIYPGEVEPIEPNEEEHSCRTC